MLGCVELGGRLDLAVEPLTASGDFIVRGGDHLHRHQPLHPPVLGLEDHAHAALASLSSTTYSPKTSPLVLPW